MDKLKIFGGGTERWRTLGIIILSMIAALLVGSIFIVIMGQNPLEAYKQLLISPFTTGAGIGQILRGATPLIIIGVGVALAGHCGVSNMGGDGQYYMGTIGMMLVSVYWGEKLGGSSLFVGLLFGMLLGMLTAMIGGIFKAYFKVSEIITTLMLNYIIEQLVGWMVRGPIQAEGTKLGQSAPLHEWEKIPKLIQGSAASYTFFVAVASVLVFWFILYKTPLGYNIKTVGGSIKAAIYNGTSPKKYYIIVMAISGLFSGLAGVMDLCGNQGRLQEGISDGFGFDAMLISLIGVRTPWGVFFAAILMSLLKVGGYSMQISCKVPVTLVEVIRGLMVLFILWGMSQKEGDSSFKGLKKIFGGSKKAEVKEA